MSEHTFSEVQILICQRLLARAQTLLQRPGWRQVVSLQHGAQTLGLESGWQPNLIPNLLEQLAAEVKGSELWMLIAFPFSEADLVELKSCGVARIVALSDWPEPERFVASLQWAQALGISYDCFPMSQCRQFNLGRVNQLKYQRPWYHCSQGVAPHGEILPLTIADQSGYFRHYAKRFDCCVLPWQWKEQSKSVQYDRFMYECCRGDYLYLLDKRGEVQHTSYLTNSAASQLEALHRFFLRHDLAEVCLDGVLELTQIMAREQAIDESKQAFLVAGVDANYELLSNGVMQTTKFEDVK
ncbi:hypothetical protein ACSLBF_02000 [Pseudoalteromonas sp. T1lg65]|uniref:hypothetical protein n=1 Tax=Pseudoalteromonas sp. T1lg65 TaxID=2077101 RepID=UPI003F7B25C7